MDILLAGIFIRVFCLKVPSVTFRYSHHRIVSPVTINRIHEKLQSTSF